MMLCEEVRDYLSTAKGLPFFYAVGDRDYLPALNELLQEGLTEVRVSDFCPRDDRFPNIDELIDYFLTSDVDYRSNKCVVVGMGEYLALKGSDEALGVLRRLKNTTLGNARVVLLLRGVQVPFATLVMEDNRIREQKRVYCAKDLSISLSLTNVSFNVGLVEKTGLKALLKMLEDGKNGQCFVQSNLIFDKSLIPVSKIEDAFATLRLLARIPELKSNYGTSAQWEHLLGDYIKCNKRIDKVFEKNQVNTLAAEDFHDIVSGYEYRNWLYFLFLKMNASQISDPYLKFVIETTEDFENLKTNFLIGITRVSHTHPKFSVLYQARKKLMKDFSEADAAVFVKANEVDPQEAIYRLTDLTLIEKRTIVQWVSRYGMTSVIKQIYPDLWSYSKKYVFDSFSAATEFTEYFDLYKKQKLCNRVFDGFTDKVVAMGKSYKYAKLPTRNSVIDAIPDKMNTFLYWIDAMGVEYLPLVLDLARKKGLSLRIDIARSDLPTITSVNKQFFDLWVGEKKKESRLDEIKHNEEGGFYFSDRFEEPIHIPSELQVISDAIDIAATKLAMHECHSFVIASDHGSSRLAVIAKQVAKHDTDTQGEHSGRCCKVYDNCELDNAIEENGYLVLFDYGRFRGSRTANIEVHGGATLEEVVVPIITLKLKKQTGVRIQVINPETIIMEHNKGASVLLYISDVDNASAVSICVNGVKYPGVAEDNTHFRFCLREIKKRAKPYQAEVFDGNDLIGSVEIPVKGKMVNADFDDLF